MMPMDYSASSSLTIIYDDSLLTGCPGIRRTIGETACEMGGTEVDKAICELIRECVTNSGAHIEVSTVNPDGTWDCKCGTKGLTGKFCSECGYPRPTA